MLVYTHEEMTGFSRDSRYYSNSYIDGLQPPPSTAPANLALDVLFQPFQHVNLQLQMRLPANLASMLIRWHMIVYALVMYAPSTVQLTPSLSSRRLRPTALRDVAVSSSAITYTGSASTSLQTRTAMEYLKGLALKTPPAWNSASAFADLSDTAQMWAVSRNPFAEAALDNPWLCDL